MIDNNANFVYSVCSIGRITIINELVELLYIDNPPVHITDIRLLAVPMLASQYDQIDYIQFRDFIVIVHALIYKY